MAARTGPGGRSTRRGNASASTTSTCTSSTSPTGDYYSSWRAMEDLHRQGLIKAIGVSNFHPDRLVDLIDHNEVTPAVNQIEWSPLLFDQAILDGHRERGVALEGYSALRGGTLQHPVVAGIAERMGRSPAQVIIRWHLEHDVVVIPKSRDRERIAANADVDDFVLSAEDVAALHVLSSTG